MKKGFSLIEIMVTIAIIILLSSFGIGAFNTSRDRARLEEDVSKIVFAIRKAQNSALAPSRTETGVSNDRNLCAIGVSLNSGTGVTQPFYKVSPIGSSGCGASAVNYGSTNQLSHTKANSSIDFEFSVPFADTTEKQVTLSLGSMSKTITVTSSGLIQVK